MREGVASSETIGYGLALLKYTAQGSQTDTPCQWRPDSGRITPTDTTHNGDAHWDISIGLSAVLWISIPAAASIVAPQRRKKEEEEDHKCASTFFSYSKSAL